MKDMVLKDKVAVITGGSRGLGLAIAQTYARAGAKVVIASRTPRAVDLAVDSLRASGYQATGLACDVADMAQVEALAQHAIQTFGRMDIWVNNAGLSAPYGPTVHIPRRDFITVINTNIIGTYNGSIVAMRHFLAQKSGKLINLLGRGDKGSIALQNAYSSSKVWVRNFTKTLANEYRNSGVDIFGFNPGLVRTEMLSNVHAVVGYEEQMNPLRFVAMLWGNDADVPAEKALWLASPATDGKNGTMVTVLTKRMMLSRLIALPFRKLLNRSTELLPLNVTSVKSAISGD
ncbi:SDR family oxidoreductase [Candidatus Villigracilis affinis]|uniref:SDR family NAD(P)-dependent oxidoreductase n=1 Tax=Candidatus Villigracilis affinis TaxID=3140682 RepID=UPI002A18F5AA|nr:SDR family oxidoreductase [Anaerolineales bacterium]